MLKKMLFFVVAASLTQLAPAQSAEIKIGVINMQRALTETNDGKAALEKLKVRLEADYKVLQSRQDELKKIEDELTQQGYMLSESAKAEKQEKLRHGAVDFQKFREEKNKEFVGIQREATERIMKKMMDQVKKYAKVSGLSLVLESSFQTQATPGSVVFSDEKLDITDKMIELYNKETKGSETPSPAK
ncbi:MAG: OmpH family outer membrane protein [Nitrospinae bacterium]|nr:OmpH family outer membrane protein [Nitrospinota bacterium]